MVRPLKICRLDAFLSGYDVKFLEFNADSPAGIGYTDVLYEGLRRSIALPRVADEFETAYTPMLTVTGTSRPATSQGPSATTRRMRSVPAIEVPPNFITMRAKAGALLSDSGFPRLVPDRRRC